MIKIWFTKDFRSVRVVSLVLIYLIFQLVLPTEIMHAKTNHRMADDPSQEENTLYFPSLSYDNYRDYTTPSTPYPPDGATDVSINTFFRWNNNPRTLPDDSSPYDFEVYLAPGETASKQPIVRVSRNALDTGTLIPDTLYTWRIVSIDPEGRRSPGPEWRFRTLSVARDPSEIADLNAMVPVPAGEFIMGCDRNNPHDESNSPCEDGTGVASKPLHTVYLDAFEIDKYEVSNASYKACVDAGVCDRPREEPVEERLERYGEEKYGRYPVVYVSRQDALDYCGWQGKRLPTEAEWEKAARGSIDTRAWPWGNEQFSCDRMHIGRDSECSDWVDVVPIGMFPNGMSPYGALDVSGNAAEWVNDKFDRTYYSWSPYANPRGSDVSRVFTDSLDVTNDDWGWPTYVLRGGDFWGRFYYHHVYYRYFGHWGEAPHFDDIPLFRNRRTGFRCARSIAE